MQEIHAKIKLIFLSKLSLVLEYESSEFSDSK